MGLSKVGAQGIRDEVEAQSRVSEPSGEGLPTQGKLSKKVHGQA